ncbi:hypothetical protein B7759_03093 [Burkholderia glumae]|nr:hypothetical protein CG017_00872 [Burkholderia glumae]QTP34484.1 hypothetical protein B7759_03093 [Burkholderia glumae]
MRIGNRRNGYRRGPLFSRMLLSENKENRVPVTGRRETRNPQDAAHETHVKRRIADERGQQMGARDQHHARGHPDDALCQRAAALPAGEYRQAERGGRRDNCERCCPAPHTHAALPPSSTALRSSFSRSVGFGDVSVEGGGSPAEASGDTEVPGAVSG